MHEQSSSLFQATFFANNRKQVRKNKTLPSTIVVTANGLLQQNSDVTYPFHQDANFWYLTGIDEPDVILVMDGDTEYLISPSSSEYQNVFDGVAANEELKQVSGISTVYPSKEGWDRLKKTVLSVEDIGTMLSNGAYIDTFGMYTNPSREALIHRLQEIHPAIALKDIRMVLAGLRVIKQPAELQAMQQAIDITVEALQRTKAALQGLTYAYEAESIITGYFLSRGASNAWTPTVGAGKQSVILHSKHNHYMLKPHDVMVVDIGARYQHYCADISRTFVVGGHPSSRQQDIHEAVQTVQSFAMRLQKPGASIKENERATEAYMGEQLSQLGISNDTDRAVIRKYFPHATSHFLGLDPHDAGLYDEPLKSGMVITVEPGIYLPNESLGVRIEDDLLITAEGHIVLSRHMPRSL